MEIKKIRIGTRGSALALAQTKLVEREFKEHYPDIEIETVIIQTKGDKIQNKPLPEFGDKGVFITEIEEALQRGEIDLAVHSAKDMPMELGEGLVFVGVLPREDARDVLVTRKGCDVFHMTNPVIGTSSLRRHFQMKNILPDATFAGIRGNVPTRLKKLSDGTYDGIILAAAGLKRLGMEREKEYEYRYFDQEEMLSAGGQGIIAIEGREGDPIVSLIQHISDEITFLELLAERQVLKTLEAGCHSAIGTYAETVDDLFRIRIWQEEQGKIFTADDSIKLDMEKDEKSYTEYDKEHILALAERLASSLLCR